MSKTWLAVLTGAVVIAGLGFGINQIFAGEGNPALTEKEAAQKAEERYPGTVKEIELDDKGTRHVYEIELLGSNGEYEIKMDAGTGEILKVEQSRTTGTKASDDGRKGDEVDDVRDDQGGKSQPAPEKSATEQKRISYEQAKNIALSKFNGKIGEIELDEDDGRWIYEVEIKKGRQEADMEIDAYTGKILFMSIENDD
ncbi:PepSY domain-containing protein [Thermoactinomyces mirandus]|uniref:PepSY domain-containing protein n=1 Tax=Thermoactinomyces mirandus TaxID=2756294 RepID=A0A7W1XS02_9BACL|nr:PepSY domain-containing protein [Thermoactinomyces mirandus]MBA4602232.1 PepSY domain-containing protein [Thermoactinomyces mirandus]